MIGIAKTGSGKTLAFLLPLFRHMNAQPELEEGDGPIAIIMTPTRELCMQIGKEIKKFARATKGARHVCVYGGTSISEQIAELKRGAEIIGQYFALFLLFVPITRILAPSTIPLPSPFPPPSHAYAPSATLIGVGLKP